MRRLLCAGAWWCGCCRRVLAHDRGRGDLRAHSGLRRARAYHPGRGGGFGQGFEHPLTGPDHFLAMFAVGIWGAQMGGRAVWALPVTFPLIMAAGGVAGMLGMPLPARRARDRALDPLAGIGDRARLASNRGGGAHCDRHIRGLPWLCSRRRAPQCGRSRGLCGRFRAGDRTDPCAAASASVSRSTSRWRAVSRVRLAPAIAMGGDLFPGRLKRGHGRTRLPALRWLGPIAARDRRRRVAVSQLRRRRAKYARARRARPCSSVMRALPLLGLGCALGDDTGREAALAARSRHVGLWFGFEFRDVLINAVTSGRGNSGCGSVFRVRSRASPWVSLLALPHAAPVMALAGRRRSWWVRCSPSRSSWWTLAFTIRISCAALLPRVHAS